LRAVKRSATGRDGSETAAQAPFETPLAPQTWPAKTRVTLKFLRLFPFRIRRRLGAFHLGREQTRHFWMALALGEIAPLFEHLERTRYVALGEIDAGLAKDAA